MKRTLEIVLNTAVMAISIGLLAFLVGQHIAESHRSVDRVDDLRDIRLSVPGITWGDSARTLVLVLSTKCHFCTQSAPFYSRLLQKAGAKGIPIVAVLPESSTEAEAYFESLNIRIKNVGNVPLASVHAHGTPTVMMVNSNGEVTNSWIGQLSSAREQDVFAKL